LLFMFLIVWFNLLTFGKECHRSCTRERCRGGVCPRRSRT